MLFTQKPSEEHRYLNRRDGMSGMEGESTGGRHQKLMVPFSIPWLKEYRASIDTSVLRCYYFFII